jgi:putative chitinase
MTPDQLKKILPNFKYVDAVCKSINDTCQLFEINTRNRVCHFLAQILHESGGLRYTEELASGKQYEGRKDLGNTLPGFGVKYKGRGFIQITGYSNYKLVGEYFGVDFLAVPEKLAQNPWNMLSAGWFWKTKNINVLADKDDIVLITKRINGGLNGYDSRLAWYEKLKKVII